MEFDLVVIGAGAAGLAAARAARQRDATVALVSSGPLGGDCTFYGCVPSKTLIEAGRQGLDFATAMARVRATVARVAATEDAETLRSEGLTVIEGTARLAGRSRLDIDGVPVGYRRLVIATGSSPVAPDLPGLASAEPLTNETVFDLDQRPGSLLVIGGGPIGVELGQAFARFGTSVTIVESGERLLPREEPDASAIVTATLAADGVEVHTGRHLAEVAGTPGQLTARLDDGSTVGAERVLVAVGRRPVTAALDLPACGIDVDDRGHIRTDTRLRTNAPGVYAAGDVTGRMLLTHAADEMGRIAASNALARFPWRRLRDDAIPWVTYTTPEVARFGLTEAQAAERIPGARVAELPLDELDRAVTAGRTDGYIKLVVAPRGPLGNLAGGRLVGATIVADRAGEMIAPPVLTARTHLFPAVLAITVQAYPTWTLGIRQAAAQLFTETGGRRARPARATQTAGATLHRRSAPASPCRPRSR